MSREIRFRAWDNSRNMMLYGKDIEETIDVYEDADGDEIEKYRYTEGLSYGSLFVSYYDDNEEWKECELMQFTGLHDRLGQDIYEGDILRTESEKVYLLSGMPSGKTSISLSVVIWKDDGWGYRFAKNIQNADYTNNFESKGLTVKAQYSDVVGNIYEHPHLISELPGR